MSRFCFCNCPAGFSAAPERHAPDCPGRFGAGKAPTPVPATLPASKPVDSGVDFGIEGRSVRVSQEAYSIFLAREAASQEKIAALQQRLSADDQLICDQRVALMRIHDRAEAFVEDGRSMLVASIDMIRDIAAKALGTDGKPPSYKPGLYAVRHIDNWDGERDVVLTFAMLDADGKWTDKETGEPLLKYTGDKVLRAWPLDCSDAPATQIIGVPRQWLEDWALELVEAAQDGGQMSNQVEHLLEIHAKP
ncbi:hypothetical protein [Pseudomonas rhodesiae]|uniref:hypothetical protein n=1 Tax=Pseudomonas rhodesiae TaxID=76760 RepID=UPI001FCA1E3B|nr:hypothetical protein [Pseudomonas rhodesiae]